MMAFISLILAFIYIALLQWFTKPILYISIAIVPVNLIAGMIMAIQVEKWFALPFVVCIVFLFFLLWMYWSQVQFAVKVIETAADFINDNKRVYFVPFVGFLLTLPVTYWWTACNMSLAETNKDLFVLMVFSLFWVLAFINAVEKFVISVATCQWYFSGGSHSDAKESIGSVSLLLGLKWTFKYNFGTMAFGSLLIAFMNLVKWINEQMMKAMAATPCG